ncbi:MAG: YkvA family protein [Eubacteriales bacterium]|nr:DUF1232 domain-containing protein [Bacillota bacterium]MBV1769804.1 DUF1232 domain-containing protein [Desulforudis sp.]MDZ4042679.1 YkvA family protein [Eubacteriales bacterium]MDZ7610620.1 YkvA family protein [Eubacteriales bacterium]
MQDLFLSEELRPGKDTCDVNYWKLGPLLLRLPKYGKLLLSLSQEPTLSLAQRLTLAGTVIYAFSPIDLIPGVIPILGQVDDLVVLLVAIRSTVYSCPDRIGRRHLKRAGLELEEIESDYRLLVETAGVMVAGVTRIARATGVISYREVRRAGRSIGQGGMLGLGMMRQALAGSKNN